MLRKRRLSKLFGFIMAAAMVLSMNLTVFAANDPATATTSAEVTVSKTITAAEADAFPAVDAFEFKLEADGYYGGPEGTGYTAYTKANMPMPSGAANVDGTMTSVLTVDGFTSAGTDAGSDNKTKTLSDTFPAITFTQAGLYTYKLTETVPADTAAGLNYDSSVYYVNVYVTNVVDSDTEAPVLDPGTQRPLVTVSAITATKDRPVTDPTDEDAAGVTEDDGTKTGSGNIPGNGDPASISYQFNNLYSTQSLEISNQVKGTLGDVSKEFTYSIALAGPAGEDDAVDYSYVVYSYGDDGVKGGADDSPVSGKSGTLGDGDTFTLKHHEYIKIVGLPEGEKVTVTATDAEDYETSIQYQHGTGSATIVPADAKTAGEQTISVAEGALNVQDFTHSKDSATPTGIFLDILPFILIAAVAVAGGVLLFAKRRGTSRR